MTRTSHTHGYLPAILGSCIGSFALSHALIYLVSLVDHSYVLSTPVALAYVLGVLLGALGGCWLALAWFQRQAIASTLIRLLVLLPIAILLVGLLTSMIHEVRIPWSATGGCAVAVVLARWLAVRRSPTPEAQ